MYVSSNMVQSRKVDLGRLLYLQQSWKYDRELYNWGYFLGKVYIGLCTFHKSMTTVLKLAVKNIFNEIKKVWL